MTNFYIKYNPYTVECIFKKDGRVLDENSKIGSKSNERLQTLLGESSLTNWKGLPAEIAIACDDDAVEITFEGRKIDFDDLKSTIDSYTGEVQFSLKFIEAKNDADVMSSLDQIFSDIKKKNLPAFQQKNAEGKDIFDAYEEVKNGIFEVSVIATMSSGKSTLINSLLNTELLPSENKACTATIVKILDNDEMTDYEAECFGSDGETVIHPRDKVDLAKLKEYNADERISFINIEGSIPGIPADKIRLQLRDTPGPNNSREENHERLTYSIIKNTNAVVLYVMNATQMEINDDKHLLEDISLEMKKAGKQSRDRFIFVINKCDQLDEEKGETLDKTLAQARDYLKSFGIVDPTIIPTSAKLALLIRKSRNGEKLTRQETITLSQVDDFVTSKLLHFEDFATLTPTVREKLKKKATEYHENEDTWDLEALIHTGVPAVEETICEYIDKYAYPMKVYDAIKDIDAVLRDLNMQSKFAAENALSESRLQETRRQIADAKQKQKRSESIYNEFKKKIDQFSFDSISEDKELFRTENELNEMTRPYDGQTSIDKNEATSLISSFKDKLEDYQKDCEARLRRYIESNVYQRGNYMLDEYTRVVKQTLQGLNIQGYEFRDNYAFRSASISNIDELQRKYEHTRYRYETRTIKNPEREGWGFFKFWVPWHIEYKTRVEDGTDVNVKAVIVDIMSDFSSSIKKNIKSMFAAAQSQVEDYKDVFNKNIDSLNREITRILDRLDEETVDSEKLQEEVRENEELAEWEANTEQRIRNVLMF